MSKRGENIYKRKDGRWEGRYVKDRINGKLKYGYVYAKTYKAVKEQLRIQGMQERPAKEKPMTAVSGKHSCNFEQLIAEWLTYIKPQIKESSYVKYSNIIQKHLLPRFRGKNIEDISREEVGEFCVALLSLDTQRKGALAPKTVDGIISVLKNFFLYAAGRGYVVADIKTITVKQEKRTMHVFSVAEQTQLTQYLTTSLTPSNLGILVCLYTGLRVGEICALKWEDILVEEQCIKVNKTMQRLQNLDIGDTKTRIVVTTPKSECSIRKIPIPNEIFQHIIANQKPGNAYFLTGEINMFIEPRTLQNHFKTVLAECRITNANFHILRHTFATRCIELGFDVKSLSEILGHASVNITMNRYVHPSMTLKKQNMDKLSTLLSVK